MLNKLFILIISLFALFSCKNNYKDTEDILPPKVTTGNIDFVTKTISGEITSASDGIIAYGHVWAKTSTPSINDNKTDLGPTNTAGSFSSELSGLIVGDTYYVAAYVQGSLGKVFYGEIKEFIAPAELYEISTGDFNRNSDEIVGTISGEIRKFGDLPIQQLGYLWSLSTPPNVNNSTYVNSTLSGNTFTSSIEVGYKELGEIVYLRSYLQDEEGNEVFGEVDSFKISDVWVPIAIPTGFPSLSNALTFVKNNQAFLIPNGSNTTIWTFDGIQNQFSQRNIYVNFSSIYKPIVLTANNEAYGFFLKNDYPDCSNVYQYTEDFGGQDSWTRALENANVLRCCPTNYSLGFTINNKAYIGFGQVSIVCSDGFYEYDPLTNSVEARAPGLRGICRGVGFSINDKGYALLGVSNEPTAFLQVMEYDPQSDSWRFLTTNFPGPPLDFAVGFSIGDKGYVTLGNDLNGNHRNELYEFDPSDESWTNKQAFPGSLGTFRNNAISFVIGKRAFIGNGDLWMYVPD